MCQYVSAVWSVGQLRLPVFICTVCCEVVLQKEFISIEGCPVHPVFKKLSVFKRLACETLTGKIYVNECDIV